MPNIKGLKRLIAAVQNVQALAEEVKEAYDEKQDWLDQKTEKYQDSVPGIEWEELLTKAYDFITDIENIDIPELD